MLYHKVTLLAYKCILETYYKIVDIFKIKSVIVLPRPLFTFIGLNLSPQSTISCFYGYNWVAVDNLSCLFKVVICNCIYIFLFMFVITP